MNRLTINLEALLHNIRVLDSWMESHGASWTLVTKVLCGHADTLKALQHLGVKSMADSRIMNIKAIERIFPDFEAWYLRLPHASVIKDVISMTDVSLNSEIETIEMLNAEAKKQNKKHRIIIMIELGDLREGILPGSLIKFYEHIFSLYNIEVDGIGANFGCLGGVGDSIDQIMQLVLYKELIELKFNRKLRYASGGSSVVLPLMLEGTLSRQLNHFRIGEAVFLGTDLISGNTLQGLRNDAITMEAEVVEIRKKSLVPMGSTSASSPFQKIGDDDFQPGERGYRAIITMGQLDTEVGGLTPLHPNHKIAGASSDLTVVNIGPDKSGLELSDTIKFRPDYAAFLRAMSGKYIAVEVTPPIEAFTLKHDEDTVFAVPLKEISKETEN